MRAVVNTDAGIDIVDAPEPEADADGVRLRIAAAGICGTDVQLAAAGVTGFVYGHEMAGVADDGTAYFVEPNLFCGDCEQCRSGNTQRCTGSNKWLGLFYDGGLAESIVVPPSALLQVPEGLDVKDAALIDPAAVAWHAVRRARLEPGDRLLVVGGGTIGLLAAATAKHLGFQADVKTRYDHQSAAAERLGLGSRDGSAGGYDVVIDAAGSESSLAEAARAARPEGRIVSLGVYLGDLPAPGRTSLDNELVYINSYAYGRDESGVRDVAQAAGLLASAPELARVLITHRFPLEQAAEAFRVAGDHAGGSIKVLIEP